MLGKGRKSSAGRKNVNKRRNERRGEDIVGEEGRKEINKGMTGGRK